MLDSNNKNLKHMQETDKDISKYYVFNLGKGLGPLSFKHNKENIIEILGKPNQDDFVSYESDDYSETIRYKDIGISICFRYFDNKYDSCEFFTNDLIVEDFNLKTLKKKELLSLIESFHKKNKRNYILKYEKGNIDEYYFFPSIGITFWWINNQISEFCISEPSLSGIYESKR